MRQEKNHKSNKTNEFQGSHEILFDDRNCRRRYECSRTETKSHWELTSNSISKITCSKKWLITAPPSTSVPVSSSLVFNALQLPSPPSSPDYEREELTKYNRAMGQYASITPSSAGFLFSWTLILTSF
jgi:hypothetical protein